MLVPPDSAGGCGRQPLPGRASPSNTKERQTALSNVRFITRHQPLLISSARREPVTRFRLRVLVVYTIPSPLLERLRFCVYGVDPALDLAMKVFERVHIMRGLFIVCVVLRSISCHPQTARHTQTDSSELKVFRRWELLELRRNKTPPASL